MMEAVTFAIEEPRGTIESVIVFKLSPKCINERFYKIIVGIHFKKQ